ncbi:hypothetical protein CF70_034285 [Cupriavidus sp. SK-3]|uniref:hypothetical protein n=1 Tax=Cupriavidus TaxID=106589 RepID=UPI00045194D3|nr:MULTISPECIES: hypothetical protein [Cupriavidus]KDP87783.1 hypothetical protein CF70_034285 [Cupriavidus sp. SK-3]MDF3883264.1 hypothetical protein [Cupriavidus basilensis]
MEHVFELEADTQVPWTGSYIASYRDLVSYFSERDVLSAADVVRGAHMVYGWMPTVLDINPGLSPPVDLHAAAGLLMAARAGRLTHRDLSALKRVVNNSIVGASKLLHFVAPDRYAIWDSKVCAFSKTGPCYAAQVNRVDRYERYLDGLTALQRDARFPAFHASVNRKVGYDVTGMRALELIMFLNA